MLEVTRQNGYFFKTDSRGTLTFEDKIWPRRAGPFHRFTSVKNDRSHYSLVIVPVPLDPTPRFILLANNSLRTKYE